MIASRYHLKIIKALMTGLLLTWPADVSAHEGPPYPIIVDRATGPCVVSVWADPDVGTGVFFIILEPHKGQTLPEEIRVEVCVQPLGGRLAEACYSAEREDVRARAQYKAEVPFDKQEIWRVRIILQSSTVSGEAAVEVEVTPPGMGRWDLVIYLFPFVAVGILWLRAFLRKRKSVTSDK